MSDGSVHFTITDGVAFIVFDRPKALNAFTFEMYDQLSKACTVVASDSKIRVVTFQGAGKAFTAGTEIREFVSFNGAEDGIAYERRIESLITTIEELPVPTIAIVDGPAMGGGLAIAIACDFRIATPSARFGVPIARTLGNCLSLHNTARLVAAFGPARAKRLLLLAETISAQEALDCGFLVQMAESHDIQAAVAVMCRRLSSYAPITMRVAKEAILRLVRTLPEGDDLLRTTYGSDDFRAGVRAFLTKQQPEWTGR